MTTTELKQRIAECISHPPLNGCDTRDLLRDCLKHIEELEELTRAKLNEANKLDAQKILGLNATLELLTQRLESSDNKRAEALQLLRAYRYSINLDTIESLLK